MTNQATHPQYLPSVDRALEYRAGLLPAAPASTRPAPARPARQWLGTDFTCSTEPRPDTPEAGLPR